MFFFLPLFLFSQEDESSAKAKKLALMKDFMYHHEFSGGVKMQTNGVDLYLVYGRLKNIYISHLFQVEYQFFINYKDKLISPQPQYDGRKYYYGLQNQLHTLRFSYGFERVIADKAERNGVRLSFVGYAGFSLGLIKPHYVEIYKGRSATGEILHESIRYNGNNDSNFMNQDSIYGAAPSLKGTSQIVPTVGGHLKAGLNFDWGSKERFVKTLEAGVIMDVFYRKVPIYVNNDANSFIHPALYIGFRFGKRW